MGECIVQDAYCLKGIGIELAHMAATKPRLLWLDVYHHHTWCHGLRLRPQQLHTTPQLTGPEKALLALDDRQRGERRPKRLTFGRWHPFPLVYHRVLLPGTGLLVPGHHPWPRLRLVFWIHLYDPLPWEPIVYLLGSTPRQHPCINLVRWVRHTRWTLAHTLGHYHQVEEEQDHGRLVRVFVGWKDPLEYVVGVGCN